MNKLKKYLAPKKEERKSLPTKISAKHVELASKTADRLKITLREFLEAAIELAAEESK